ncbi:DUF2937 family protein [Falsiroseomonas sp.]|uniref:DUF2937 family protein n=1 Tax=Falsiroseomonas sp. TaxID=2870721 RepID=UPI00271D2A06|nr:DUF2937 family protein [Falsiroseomonas sp.]MDO9503704.1 DUF2937 family protein [Falsiroseomonas sp.]
MRFLARWLGQSILMAAGLIGFLLAVQAPAWTEHYTAALQQRAEELRLDIDGRIDAMRRYYDLPATAPREDIARLMMEREPANAAALREADQRRILYETAYSRIRAASPLFRPLVAGRLIITDAGPLSAVAESASASYSARLPLTLDALSYGLFGLVLALFLVEILFSLLAGLARPSRSNSWRRRAG